MASHARGTILCYLLPQFSRLLIGGGCHRNPRATPRCVPRCVRKRMTYIGLVGQTSTVPSYSGRSKKCYRIRSKAQRRSINKEQHDFCHVVASPFQRRGKFSILFLITTSPTQVYRGLILNLKLKPFLQNIQ